MIIREQRDDVMVGGAKSIDAFTIKASAKAFAILSNNLYSNPTSAVIRELSTNAYDAHVMVDKADEPFILQLPTSLDPTFIVRDFGPGLSEQEIMTVYTTFFESTKTGSNDFVGALGLGSKSPFGIADSFTITSYQAGVKRVYSAFLNDARIPSIAFFGAFPTDEESGLEVSVAVKEDNFKTFANEVNNQLKYFVVKPIIKGNTAFKWNSEEEYMYEGETWKMVDTTKGSNYGRGGARVIQGQIQYPINTNDMGKHYSNASQVIKEILNRPIVFTVNIGAVNIAPSRENLTYDDQTCINIIAAAQKIVEELPTIIRERIQNAETEYEARILFNNIMNDLNKGYYGNRALIGAVSESGKILWKGKDVSSTTVWIPEDEIRRHVTFTCNHSGRFSRNIKAVQKSNGYDAADHLPDGKPHWNMQVTELKNTVWILATDTDTAVEVRAKQYANDNHGRNSVTHIITSHRSLNQIARSLGLKNNQIIIASTLAKVRRSPASTAQTSGSKNEVILQLHTGDGSSRAKSNTWSSKAFEDISKAEGYYVELDRFDVMRDGKIMNNFESIRKAAIELNIIKATDPIYGLRKMMLKTKHTLKNLFDTVEAALPTLPAIGATYDFGEHNRVMNKLKENRNSLIAVKRDIGKDSPVMPIINAVLAESNTTRSQYVRHLVEYFKVNTQTIDMSAESTAADKRYSLIPQMGYYVNSDMLIQYINDMDELHTLRGQCASCTKQ